MTIRAVVYARVSTSDQADRGYSLPSQLAACRKYADTHGLSVVVDLSEDISGATRICERPEGARLSAMVARGEVVAIVVHQIDRLSRDLVDLLATVRGWLRSGIQVHAGDVGRIESEFGIGLVITGLLSSIERVKIRERTMRGKREKARAGHVVGGREPYGYGHVRDDSGRVVMSEVYDPEAEIIRMIYLLYLEGDGDGKPLSGRGIAKRLSAQRLPSPGEVRPSCQRVRALGIWSTVSVLNILGNELYAGVWRYGVRIGSTSETYPESQQVRVDVPAIVDRATWGAAQERKKRNKRMAKRNRKRQYLLHGLIKCGCGYAMCGFHQHNHKYYRCNERRNRHKGIEKLKCQARSVRAEAIEADVWDSFHGVFSNLARLEGLLGQAQAEELEAQEPKRAELANIDARIAEAEQTAAVIARRMVKASGVVGRALEQEAETVNAQHVAQVRRRAELQEALSVTRITDEAIRDTVKFAGDVRLGLEHVDDATKRRILESLELVVVVSDGHFSVKSAIGDWNGEVRRIPSARWNSGIVDSSS